MLASYLVHAWYNYQALRSQYLPDFVLLILKGSLVYVIFMAGALYFVARWVYRIPMDYHPLVVILCTLMITYFLMMVLAELPMLAVRLTMEAPLSISAEQIVNDAWMPFIIFYIYTPYLISCVIFIVATLCYIGWLVKICLKARLSQCKISCWLAYIILSLCALNLCMLFGFL